MNIKITTEDVKKLRDKTGISVMQCKKALEEAEGDEQKALAILQSKGKEIASKKGERTLGAGIIASYIHSNGAIGAMVELSCESDFVAKNEEFKTLAYDIAMHAVALNPKFVSDAHIKDEDRTVITALFAEEVAKSGKPKNIQEKMLEGKLGTYFKEQTLLDQSFVKNPDITIKGLIDSAIQKFGERIEVARFTRFSVLGR
ncbi:MAG: elongation factor Ts [bacterium]|nr:elongation factor Ts [bacterium]